MLVLAAVVLTGVTGCANRPNNLETYYNNAGNASTPTSGQVEAPNRNAAVQSTAQSAPNTVATQVAAEVTAAVLTSSDLAGQGVHAASTRPANGACLAAVPAGDPQGASWLYGSGSSLVQEVTGYLDRSATDVLNQVHCGGVQLSMPDTPGADVARGWCQAETCTVLLATGHVLSSLQVVASAQSRAEDAVKSVAPIASGKLPGA
ncbi:MAG TPA: hypothetical protein VFG87_29910 [Amycolatopsis sp.]|nr:hypothetical protein [Amycolatopsis sp.]